MHIPDGYLSPTTCLALYGAAAPFWYKASQRMKQDISTRMVPLLSVFAAFSFTIQMLNIPIPGGTTAHAVGGTLMAIVLGPWPAVIGMSVTLAIQALFFGDGGITTLGANAFNLAVALPLTGFGTYRLLCKGGRTSDRRRAFAAAISAYVSINVAGLLTAFELGIQPVFWSVNGQALYSPYDLGIALPTIMLTHLTLAGAAEALLTGLAVAYLLRTYPHLLPEIAQASAASLRRMQTHTASPAQTQPGPEPHTAERISERISAGTAAPRRKWRALHGLVALVALLVLATPLGLLAQGAAFGELGADKIEAVVGYIPAGLGELGAIWQLAPLPGYQLPGFGSESGLLELALAYVLSAIIGVGVIFTTFLAVRIILVRRES